MGDMTVMLVNGDCVEVMAGMDPESVDAIVCDPPYALEFMGKDWDAPWKTAGVNRDAGFNGGSFSAVDGPSYTSSTNPNCLNCGGKQRGRRDGTAVVAVCLCDAPRFPNVRATEMQGFQMWCAGWAEQALRVLKPGGHLLAFGGTRTYHRVVCAIEDAGFEIRDSIHWMYGSGFAKSLDVSKAIDKAHGVWRGRAGDVVSSNGAMSGGNYQRSEKGLPVSLPPKRASGIGTALKPAHEPIVVARKPLTGTVASNVLRYGTGGLNIDACRVSMSAADQAYIEERIGGFNNTRSLGGNGAYQGGETMNRAESYDGSKGRWPPNVLLSHADGCVQTGWREQSGYTINRFIDGAKPFGDGAGHPFTGEQVDGGVQAVYECDEGCAVVELDGQSGVSQSRVGSPRTGASGSGWGLTATGAEYSDEGGASRFFPVFEPDLSVPFRYVAKPSGRERNAGVKRCHCDKLPAWESEDRQARRREGTDTSLQKGIDVSGTPNRNRPGVCGSCGGITAAHPTIKPVALMQWLVRLVTPPGGTVLDPFLGSGTTGCAAVLEGFDFVGVEKDTEHGYLEIARARIAHAEARRAAGKSTMVDREQLPVLGAQADGQEQMGLF